MKLAKTIFLSSLTALLFTHNAYSVQKANMQSLASNEINALLNVSRQAIQPIETKRIIARQIEKQLLELQTHDLIESATRQLPKNRFKVIIAD